MVHNLQTTAEVIEALGGIAAVAEMTASNYKQTENWKRADTFPANTYVAIQAALKRKRLAAPDSLWGMKVAEAAE